MASFITMQLADNLRPEAADEPENTRGNPIKATARFQENSESFKTVQTISSIPANFDQSQKQIKTIDFYTQQLPQILVQQKLSPGFEFEQLVPQQPEATNDNFRRPFPGSPRQQQQLPLKSVLTQVTLVDERLNQNPSNTVNFTGPKSPTLTIVDLPAIKAKNKASQTVQSPKPVKASASPKANVAPVPSTSIGIRKHREDNEKLKRQDKRQSRDIKQERHRRKTNR